MTQASILTPAKLAAIARRTFDNGMYPRVIPHLTDALADDQHYLWEALTREAVHLELFQTGDEMHGWGTLMCAAQQATALPLTAEAIQATYEELMRRTIAHITSAD
ncbi:MAG: hypothetical protein K2W95_33700 [Candidatus Obscuribacterales bacterium]|nr:hypothetical protein [Candidatus Obscuribacterales bacterium]